MSASVTTAFCQLATHDICESPHCACVCHQREGDCIANHQMRDDDALAVISYQFWVQRWTRPADLEEVARVVDARWPNCAFRGEFISILWYAAQADPWTHTTFWKIFQRFMPGA